MLCRRSSEHSRRKYFQFLELVNHPQHCILYVSINFIFEKKFLKFIPKGLWRPFQEHCLNHHFYRFVHFAPQSSAFRWTLYRLIVPVASLQVQIFQDPFGESQLHNTLLFSFLIFINRNCFLFAWLATASHECTSTMRLFINVRQVNRKLLFSGVKFILAVQVL